MHPEYPVVVFSRARWSFVHHRAQHLFSRVAARHRVLFVEEPEYDGSLDAPRWERSEPERGVTVYRPRTRGLAPGFHGDQLAELDQLMPQLAADLDGRAPVAWLTTPLALPLLDSLTPSAVVYDCTDDLGVFPAAPPELEARDSELLTRADVVFTAGPGLHRAKRERHSNVHCFPGSVEAEHFSRARPRRPRGVRTGEPADQDSLPHPRLGYYGVLDERLDYRLLAGVAEARPEWPLVLVGPLARIDPAVLPRRPNIHYLGQRTYGELPAYLAGWDVCLLPYAVTDATRYFNPTRTLEYMAAERPIVSTPLADVVEAYPDVVRIADGPEAFVAACEAALAESEEERNHRVGRMREVLAHTSWDTTVGAMERVIEEALARRRDGAPTHASGATVPA